MISLVEARALIAEKVSPLRPMLVPLAQSDGRVLRQTVTAPEDLPAFDRSAFDGYALAADDRSERFRIVGAIQPGAPGKKINIGRGECVRIFTGAAIPAGTSQVLMQEDARLEGEFMIPTVRDTEANIRRRGEDAHRGDALLDAGTRLGAGELALLAGLGITRVRVAPMVRVAHIATGNELVAPQKKVRPGQIRDSNSTLVAALVNSFGGQLVKHERLPDNWRRLLKRAAALKTSFDLLLLSGGASVGDHDFGKRLLLEIGFKIHFGAVNLRPGKPLIFATRGRQAAFVLPGNPVSHLVTLHLAVRLAFERFQGLAPSWRAINAPLAAPFEFEPGKRETFWPARLEIRPDRGNKLVARALHWQSSGDVTGLAGVNALLQLPAGAPPPEPGRDVTAVMLEMP